MQSEYFRTGALKTMGRLLPGYWALRLRLAVLLPVVALAAQPLLAGDGANDKIAIAMSSRIVASPVKTADGPSVIPGTVLDYSLGVAGPSGSAQAASGFAFGTAVPDRMMLFVGDLEASGAGPVVFNDTGSGLQFNFEALASLTDALEFSNNGGQSFDYSPVPDADGYDGNVTHIRMKPIGNLNPTAERQSRFSFRYRMKVK